MKRTTFLLAGLLGVMAMQANLLFDITDGKYREKTIESKRSMRDGETFTKIVNKNAVVRYNYRTGAFVDTVFSVFQAKKSPITYISGYEFSPNEQKLLVYNQVKPRYRRTFTAAYYVYDIKRKEMYPLSEGFQEVPLFSPDSRYIAFAKNNNLFMHKLDFQSEIAITKDGSPGKIINGTPDWVYEEEFKVTRHFCWSPDSKLLAFTKFTEDKVSEFSFQQFTTTNDDALLLYPTSIAFKYPKAGEENSKVQVFVYDDFNKTTRNIKIAENHEDFYVPRIKWTNSSDQLAIFKLSRDQKQLDMIFADPRSTLSKLILRERDARFVDYENIDYMHFTADNQFFFAVSERDGYSHIYQHRITGQLVKQLTKGNWDVTDVYGYDEAKKILYFQSAQVSPMGRDIYALNNRGKIMRLSNGKGIHNATFNASYSLYVNATTTLQSPISYNLHTHTGVFLKTLLSNSEVKRNFEALGLPQKEFFSFTTTHNITLNGWMLKPVDFDSTKKYPVLQVQYSGPNSQQVLDRWNIGWEYYLATKGILVVGVDGRGTGARGTEFRKCTYGKLGILESTDQVETAKYLGTLAYVDKARIGIWGWSYGGSTTLWSMSTGESVFKAGIAVAPVTDWMFYNTAYTERFMNRPQANSEGYHMTSALHMAPKLNGRLLIIHGTADDNVHVQNTLVYIDKLVKANKQFEMQLYTDKNHSLLGKQTRRHLYERKVEFLESKL